MNVYFINAGYEGCYYVRSFLPMYVNGWSGDRLSIYEPQKDGFTIGHEMLNHEYLVFQRPMDTPRLEAAKLLKQRGHKIIFDNDDTYKISPMGKFYERKKLKEIQRNLDEFIRLADLVTTTTEYLANEYRKLNKNVVVLPNCVDPDDWDTPLRNETDKIRIGVVGSTTTTGDQKVLKPILDWLNKRDDVQIVLFGLPPIDKGTKLLRKLYKEEIYFWDKYNIEWQPFVPMSEYFETLNELRLDIMLIPRQDNYFNRCKSNIKFLEASMLEIPVIAQGFKDGNSPYQKDIVNGENGLIAITKNDWKKHIKYLIKNKQQRLIIGKNAYHYTLKNYNIHTKGHLWREAYKTI